MSNLIKNSINLGVKIIFFLAFIVLVSPISASAEGGRNTTFGEPHVFESGYTYEAPTPTNNPKPVIYSLNPKSGDQSLNPKSITITGRGFVPSSVVRINGSNRPTTFIDSTHLLVEARGADMFNRDGGFYITVANGAPGGGFSNSKFFSIQNVSVAPTQSQENQSQNSNSYSNTVDNNYNSRTETETFSDLTSNAIYGGNTFLPSGAVQWTLFAIIILLLVMFARKFFGGEERYLAVPLKHD
ncbi:MAG: IPT/TIG domain-containing protein [Minisyncoccia bacterium]